tara:strand:+ start:245 stop:478 length:234 start_codon:yes stop_codon:yes gene_type:complete
VKIKKVINFFKNLNPKNSESYFIAITKLNEIEKKIDCSNIEFEVKELKQNNVCCYKNACNSLTSVKEKLKLIVLKNE